MIACVSAAIATASSTFVETSNMRNSSVPNIGWGRTSHQIFLPLSMQFSFTRRFTKFSYALHDSNCSGTPVRGKRRDRKSTRLNSSHLVISYAVFCLKKKKKKHK